MERSAKLIHYFQNQSSSAIRLKSIASEDLERHLGDHCLLINATPVGLCPHEEVSPVPDSKYLRPDITVFDLIPNPVHTRLLRDASAAGAKIIPGIHMLVAQALASEEIWLDCKLVDSYFDPVLNHLLRTLQKNDTTSNTHIG